MSSSSSSSSSNSGVVNGREREPLIADASRKNEPIVINDARPVENNNNSPPVATAEMGRPTTYSNGNAVPVSEGRREAVIVSADGRRYYVVDRRRDRYYDDGDAEQRNMLVCIYCCLLFFLLFFLASSHGGKAMIVYFGEIAEKSFGHISKSLKLRGS